MGIVQNKIQAIDTAAQTHSITLDSAPSNDNIVLIYIHTRGHTVESSVDFVTPTSGTTAIANGTASAVGKLWRYRGTAQTFEVDHNTGGSNVAGSFMAVIEVDNVPDPDDPVDVSVVDINIGEVTSLAIGDLVTTVADTIMFMFCGVRAGGDDESFSADNSFTILGDDESQAASQPSGGGVAHRTVSSTGTYNSTLSWTDAGRCIGIGVAIKQNAAGGGLSIPVAMANYRKLRVPV